MSRPQYAVLYSELSKEDLKAIYSYIAYDLEAQAAAKHQTDRIRGKIRALDCFPEKHPAADWDPWRRMGVRRMPVDNYVVFYLIDHDTHSVRIVRIFYAGRNIEAIAAEDLPTLRSIHADH